MENSKDAAANKIANLNFLHADANRRRLFLKSILDNEIKTGFLMLFCKGQYCAENILFIAATTRYESIFANDFADGHCWSPWETDLISQQETQPRIWNDLSAEKCNEVECDMEFINNTFLKPGSEHEICISSKVLENTKRRMTEFKCYGPEVFKEARIEPFNTLLKDIMPRFVKSDTFVDMVFYANKLKDLPAAATLSVQPPVEPSETIKKVLESHRTIAAVKAYCNAPSIEHYLCDPILHNQLLKYLKRIFSVENLYCVRTIESYVEIFDLLSAPPPAAPPPAEDAVAGNDTAAVAAAAQALNSSNKSASIASVAVATSTNHISNKKSATNKVNGRKFSSGGLTSSAMCSDAIVDLAWLVYLYFIAPGSCYEVGKSSSMLKKLSLKMALPTRDMFQEIRLSTLQVLMVHFTSFKDQSVPEYVEMVSLVEERWHANYELKPDSRAPTDGLSVTATSENPGDMSVVSDGGFKLPTEGKSSRSTKPGAAAEGEEGVGTEEVDGTSSACIVS